MIHAFFGKTELNPVQEVDQAYMIQLDSGCTLAMMAVTKTLPDLIQHVYRVHGYLFPGVAIMDRF